MLSEVLKRLDEFHEKRESGFASFANKAHEVWPDIRQHIRDLEAKRDAWKGYYDATSEQGEDEWRKRLIELGELSCPK